MEPGDLAARLADHEMGLELQLIELEVRQDRARVQGQEDEVRLLQSEISILQEEMARAVEQAAVLERDHRTEGTPWISAA